MECIVCGRDDELYFRCSYCDGAFCSSHRLPESHECDGVRFLSDPGKRFESKFTGEVVEEGEGIDPPKPFKPKYTVGTTPEPEWDPSPDTELKPSAGEPDDEPSVPLYTRLLSWIRGR